MGKYSLTSMIWVSVFLRLAEAIRLDAVSDTFLQSRAIHTLAEIHESRPPELGSYGFDTDGQNLSVHPGDNFFEYVNGKALSEAVIQEDDTESGAFRKLDDQAELDVRALLEDKKQRDTKLSLMYAAFVNESVADALDLKPLQSYLERVQSVGSQMQFAALVGRHTREFGSSPISVSIGVDPRNADRHCVEVDQGGLGLPRDYYGDEQYAHQKAAYREFVEKLLGMIQWPAAENSADAVLVFEERVANVSWTNAQRRDPVATYNPMNVSVLEGTAPGFEWRTFLDTAGPFPDDVVMVVGCLSGVVGIASVLNTTDLEVLKAWAAFHIAKEASSYLSSRFVSASFDFASILSGQIALSPRWKRGVRFVNNMMGMEVGKAYVQKHFPPSSKKAVLQLANNIKNALRRRIEKLDWMTNSTKEKALKKLQVMRIKVGYPDVWKDYSSLDVTSDLVSNVVHSYEFHWTYSLSRISDPVDREEWDMNPQEVNAYYDPQMNEIVFPAAILQPPFFDPRADMAVNYGGIGSVIGHEMTHGFDDEGRMYDAFGNLTDWWTESDATEFQARASKYGEQFGNFTQGLPEGGRINPELTMGENIADFGGLGCAIDAYCTTLNNGASASNHRVLEGVRRLFFGYAQVWREKQRSETVLKNLVADPHPPACARVNLPTRNLDIWYQVFNVTSDREMFLEPAERASIWGPTPATFG